MGDQADNLRRRIAYYRRCLNEGVDLDLAKRYLAQILADEAELALIEKESDRRE